MFSKKLRKLRKLKGWDQEQLAKMLGVTRSMVSSYEINRSKPSYAILVKLAELFNVPLDYFYEESEKTGERVMQHVELSDEDFLKKVQMFYQGEPLNEEETKALLTYLRFLKSNKDNK